MANSPIADLRYRGYDGPLDTGRSRPWVIARMSLRQALRKKAYWVLTALAGWYYLVIAAIVYFSEQAASMAPAGAGFMDNFVWKDQFLHAIGFGQIIWLAVVLIVGAGSIANDNRTNALLVYLSKPCDRGDYLFGKWLGVFVPVLISMAIPSAVFYLYGALNYAQYGFLSDDPWLILRLIVLLGLLAALNATLVIGVSSLFRQGRLAGATYAGIFFVGLFFAKLCTVFWFVLTNEAPEQTFATSLLSQAAYTSITSFQVGISKLVLATDGASLFGMPTGEMPVLPRPDAWWMIVAYIVVTLLALAVAWRRIRAVEVVK